jgi:hypothetical protein
METVMAVEKETSHGRKGDRIENLKTRAGEDNGVRPSSLGVVPSIQKTA